MKSGWNWFDFGLGCFAGIITMAFQGLLFFFLFFAPSQWKPVLWPVIGISTTFLNIAFGIFPKINEIFSFTCGFALCYGFPLMWVSYSQNGPYDPRVWIAPSVSALLCVFGYTLRQAYDRRKNY